MLPGDFQQPGAREAVQYHHVDSVTRCRQSAAAKAGQTVPRAYHSHQRHRDHRHYDHTDMGHASRRIQRL